MANFGMNQFDAQDRIQRGRDEARARIERGRNQAQARIGRGGESWSKPAEGWKGRWGGPAAAVPQFAGPFPGGAGLPGNIFLGQNQEKGKFGWGQKNAAAWFPKAFAKHGHGPLGAGTGDTTMASLSPERQAEEMEGRRNVFGGVGEVKLPPGFFTGRPQPTSKYAKREGYEPQASHTPSGEPIEQFGPGGFGDSHPWPIFGKGGPLDKTAHDEYMEGPLGGSPGTYVRGENTGIRGTGILSDRFFGGGYGRDPHNTDNQIDDIMPKDWDYEVDDFGQDFGV